MHHESNEEEQVIKDEILERVRKALAEYFAKHHIDTTRLVTTTITFMEAHASARRYLRITSPEVITEDGAKSMVAMVLPKVPDKSDEATTQTGPVNPIADFYEADEQLGNLGLPVPKIYWWHAHDEYLMLLEDLGDQMLEDVVMRAPKHRVEIYRGVIDVLLQFQKNYETKKSHGIWSSRSFERTLLSWELNHFYDWTLELRMPKEAAKIKPALTKGFNLLLDELEKLPHTLVLRDFQSRNIMNRQPGKSSGEWTVIDFQDALTGPFIYDLVALLRDSYIELFPHEVEKLLEIYIEGVHGMVLPWHDMSASDIKRAFYLQTLQRKLKDAGRFIFIKEMKGNAGYLRYLQPSLDYVDDALEHLDDPRFEVFKEAIDLARSKPLPS